MNHLPNYIAIAFVLTTLLTVAVFYKASHYSKTVLFILSSWLLVQMLVALTGFYTVTNAAVPPRFTLSILPPIICIAVLFATTKGRLFIDGLDIKTLTLLHIVRIPVELVLYGLFVHKTVPQLMTFEGRNFDILSGLTAPFIYYFGFVKKRISNKLLLLWNFICLGLLVNIVVTAILSAPFPIQQFAFDQPNIAILYFPFIWLPCCVVPLVLLAHIASIKKLLNKHKI